MWPSSHQGPSVCLTVLTNWRVSTFTENCPSNPDGSDQGSVSWQGGGCQPFTLEETECLRSLGELPGQASQQVTQGIYPQSF